MRVEFFLIVFLSYFLSSSISSAREQIRIIGSSTVLPYVQIVAERFGENFPHFKTPIVESGGSGAGIKEFCKGTGSKTVDIVNASRPMMQSEFDFCAQKGVKEIQEIKFGYDGLIFSANKDFPDLSLTLLDLYHVLAGKIFKEGKFVENKNFYWDDIHPLFPHKKIKIYIPSPKHGTRNILEETLFLGCRQAIKEHSFKQNFLEQMCKKIRKDVHVVELDGDNTETFARLTSEQDSVGILGLSFYENNADQLKAFPIDGVLPSIDTVSTGKYLFSRPLFFYVKKDHLFSILGLRAYVDFFLDEQTIGPEGYLAEYGLAPLPKEERKKQRDSFQQTNRS